MMKRMISWFKQSPETYVRIRGKDCGVVGYRTTKVLYDDWGTPYIDRDVYADQSTCFKQSLNKDGTTSDKLYSCIRKHIEGPPVRFDIQEREF